MSTQETRLKAIADAIRTKENSIGEIPARSFADRVIALPAGVENPDVVLPTASTQKEQFTRIATAIRAKENSAGEIPANEFADRIAALEVQKPSRLPEGYIEVEYIDIHGNIGFSLGGTINPSTFRMVMDLSVYPDEGGGGEYFLTCNKNGNMKTWIYRHNSSSVGYMLGLMSNDKYVSISFPENKRTVCDLNWKEQLLTIDGVVAKIQNSNYTTGTPFLFNSTSGSGGWPALPCKLYSAKIYKNNVLQKDLVPCVEKSSGASGLYDMNANIFRTKGDGNTGTITPGPTV